MEINWKPGKTEIVVVHRGEKAKAEKLKCVQPNGKRMYKVTVDGKDGVKEQVPINVVSQYKHLGTIIDETGSLVPEARQRVKAAMQSFAHLAKHLLRTKMVSAKKKLP